MEKLKPEKKATITKTKSLLMKVKFALSLCAFLLLQCLLNAALAQNLQVSGQVTSRATGQPLQGASVTVKGSSTGTTTDQEGRFTLNLPNAAAYWWFHLPEWARKNLG